MKPGAQLKKLQKRIAAWTTFNPRDEGPSKRKASGVYRCPGSRKK